jgi:hypothetical protein
MKNIATKTDKTSPGAAADYEKLPAAEANSIISELKNTVLATGQTLDENNSQQVAQALTDHALGASYAEDTGTANNYILSITGSRQTPPVLVKGYRLFFQTGNVNTSTTPTLNYAGLGVKTIVAENGTDAIVAGDIKVGAYNEVVYDGTNWRLILSKVNSASETVAGKIKISTTAQTAAGEDDASAITPAKFISYLNGVKEVTTIVSGAGINATGYTRFYNIATGILIRKKVWGRVNTILGDNGVNITFPLTFTTIYDAQISGVNNGSNIDATPDAPAHMRNLTLTSVRLCNAEVATAIDVWYSIEGI